MPWWLYINLTTMCAPDIHIPASQAARGASPISSSQYLPATDAPAMIWHPAYDDNNGLVPESFTNDAVLHLTGSKSLPVPSMWRDLPADSMGMARIMNKI